MNAANQTSKRFFMLLATTISLIIAVGTYTYYVSQKQSIIDEKNDDLKAIANLKAEQLIQWNSEREADANILVKSPFFIQAVQRLNAQGITSPLEEDFYMKLLLFNEYYGYDNLILADTTGRILVP